MIKKAIKTVDRHMNESGDGGPTVKVCTNLGYMEVLSVYEADGDLCIDVNERKVVPYD